MDLLADYVCVEDPHKNPLPTTWSISLIQANENTREDEFTGIAEIIVSQSSAFYSPDHNGIAFKLKWIKFDKPGVNIDEAYPTALKRIIELLSRYKAEKFASVSGNIYFELIERNANGLSLQKETQFYLSCGFKQISSQFIHLAI